MKRWYVVQVYAGYEDAVKADLERRVQASPHADYFGRVLVPSAKLKQLFAAVDEKSQQLFPGYVLVEMELVPEAIRLVTASMRVMRFLGGDNPAPLSRKEVDRILSQMSGEIQVKADTEQLFTIGSEVEIHDGPFAGFVGMIDSVDQENERLSIMVSIFGRMTPVELGFNQVKR